ncbi:MAG: glycosyltransferase family 4 protein [Planctomycetes bacterium]|nr:glycosyltransferase family 4 protein [Planctomycetota bacterium]
MKILVFTDMFPSKEEPAAGVFVYELSKAVSYKSQVVVIHPRLWNPFNIKSRKEKLNNHLHLNDIEIYRPKLFILPIGDRLFFRAFAFLIAALPLLRKLRKTFHFDLIHAHMAGPAGFAAVLLGMLFGKPIIVTVHGSDIHTFPKHLFLRRMVIFTLKRATKVVAVSQSLKDLVSKLIDSQKNILIIRNGSRQEIFFPIDKTTARERLGLPNNKKIILFIGSLIPRKGVDVLLSAFTLLNEKNNINLLLIGEGESEPKLKALTKELHIETQVYFIGSKKHDEIPLWLNACDVFCLPSHHEGFPTVIVEAFACGRPVVATKVDGVPEAITNDTVGLLVEPNNSEALASALNKALEKEWDYQTIAEYGKRFSWDTIAEEYLELYKNAVSKI